jgi:hypothetical protein
MVTIIHGFLQKSSVFCTFFALFFFNGINDLQNHKKTVKNRKKRLTLSTRPVIMVS